MARKQKRIFSDKIFYFLNTVGPRYMRGIWTPKIDSHIMNSNIKRPRMTDN